MRADVPCKVEVEIVRHAYAREGSPTPIGGPLQTASSYIYHLRHPSEGTPGSAEQAGKGVELDVSLAGAELQRESLATKVSAEEPAAVVHAEGELNGVSEDIGDGIVTSSSAVLDGRRKRVSSSKSKDVAIPVGAGLNEKGLRRLSASEQGYFSPRVFSSSPGTTPTLPPVTDESEEAQAQDGPEDVDRRGRSTFNERKSSYVSSHPSIQHRRLESLRLAQHSREASPSRSIRFVDEPRSSTNTPHNGVLQNDP